MKVRRLAWLGVRTEAFDETTAFFRDVLGLPVGYEESGFALLELPDADHDYIEVFSAAREDLATFYSTGPVVGLLVDDIVEARAELAAAGIELLDEIHWSDGIEGYGWFHFRGPDGNVYAVLQGSRILSD